jgi:REP element-mobilizing transposase RayT
VSQSLAGVFIHLTFSTKDRRRQLTPDICAELCPYIGGIIERRGSEPIIQCATADHIHCLFLLSPNVALANLIRDIKANSSRWLRERFTGHHDFAWQNGYGAFSVSKSNVKNVAAYIASQEEHHRRVSFQEELVALLKKHEIPYDERYLWT